MRFSAMGDVVLLVPVILSVLQQYPDTKISLLTRPFFHPFFQGIPNIELPKVDLKGKHKGVNGLHTLVKELSVKNHYDAILDMHSVIRSRLIDFFFWTKNIPVYRIDKGRSEKKHFIKQKKRQVLSHTTERYSAVFAKAGFDFTLEQQTIPLSHKEEPEQKEIVVSGLPAIGIAPFAAHKSKQWGIDQVAALLTLINTRYKVHFYLYGGGATEVRLLNELADRFDNVTNLAGKYSLLQEMLVLQKMDVLIAMDSGNMHIASLLAIPVLSIWGGTHPDLGFGALYQPKEQTMQVSVNRLACRPCSVFGTNTCHLTENPFACMQLITPEIVLKQLEEMAIFH